MFARLFPCDFYLVVKLCDSVGDFAVLRVEAWLFNVTPQSVNFPCGELQSVGFFFVVHVCESNGFVLHEAGFLHHKSRLAFMCSSKNPKRRNMMRTGLSTIHSFRKSYILSAAFVRISKIKPGTKITIANNNRTGY